MTPERRRAIDTLHKMYSENLAYQPQHAVNVLVDCVRDLSIDNNSLTAEIATLKAQVEHYRTQLEQTCHGTEVLGDAIATLRTHLKALVEAGEKVLLSHDGTFYTESMNDSGAVDAFRSALDKAKGAV